MSSPLRRLRQMRLGTLDEAAKAMRISKSQLAYVETGKRSPSRECLRRIARGLGVGDYTVLELLPRSAPDRPASSLKASTP